MESFLSTLLGAFLGVSLPFIIGAIIERNNFKKVLNNVFVQYETNRQLFNKRAEHVLQEAEASWEQYRKDCSKTLSMNFSSIVDCSDLLLGQYSKYLRPSDIFLVVQDKQNTSISLNTLINSNYEKPADIRYVMNALAEFLIRRTWTLFVIAKKKDMQFSAEKYNLLIEKIGKMKNKKITKVADDPVFKRRIE